MKPSVLWIAWLGWPPCAERLQAKLVARLQSTLVEKNEVIAKLMQEHMQEGSPAESVGMNSADGLGSGSTGGQIRVYAKTKRDLPTPNDLLPQYPLVWE
jgi:hypothetical protein